MEGPKETVHKRRQSLWHLAILEKKSNRYFTAAFEVSMSAVQVSSDQGRNPT